MYKWEVVGEKWCGIASKWKSSLSTLLLPPSGIFFFIFDSVSLIFPSAGYRNKEGGGAAQWQTNRFNLKQRSIRSERENA